MEHGGLRHGFRREQRSNINFLDTGSDVMVLLHTGSDAGDAEIWSLSHGAGDLKNQTCVFNI